MTDEEFKTSMLSHMEQQTNFLCEINKALNAVKVVGSFVSGVFAVLAGGFGLMEFFKQLKGR